MRSCGKHQKPFSIWSISQLGYDGRRWRTQKELDALCRSCCSAKGANRKIQPLVWLGTRKPTKKDLLRLDLQGGAKAKYLCQGRTVIGIQRVYSYA